MHFAESTWSKNYLAKSKVDLAKSIWGKIDLDKPIWVKVDWAKSIWVKVDLAKSILDLG